MAVPQARDLGATGAVLDPGLPAGAGLLQAPGAVPAVPQEPPAGFPACCYRLRPAGTAVVCRLHRALRALRGLCLSRESCSKRKELGEDPQHISSVQGFKTPQGNEGSLLGTEQSRTRSRMPARRSSGSCGAAEHSGPLPARPASQGCVNIGLSLSACISS